MTVGFNRSVWDGEAPIVAPAPGARTIGDLALVEIGFSAWSKSRRDHREEAVGGVILDVFDHLDTETGEVERAFKVLDTSAPKLRLRTLLESDVDVEAFEPINQGRLRGPIRRAAEEVFHSTGPLTTRHIDCIRWQHTLAGVVVPR